MQNINEEIELLIQNEVAAKELLAAHLHTPEKADVYYQYLKKSTINGNLFYTASWSWWGFFVGVGLLFYRKLYAFAFMVLALEAVFIAGLPIFALPAGLLPALTGKYFYLKKFLADLQIAGYGTKPIEEVKQNLTRLGGRNQWVIVVGITLLILATVLVAYLYNRHGSGMRYMYQNHLY